MARSGIRTSAVNQNARGFSLIEVAIALMVIGILLASVLQMYNLYAQSQIKLEVGSDIETVKSALSRHVYRYGRYPLPAPRNAALGSATIGREVTPPVITPCPSATAGQVCYTTTGSVDTVADADSAPDRVLVGEVPFATLGIKYNNIIDPWGGKLVYAVSENLTDPSTYDDSWGAIEVYDVSGSTVFSGGLNHAHYFLFSAGPDRKGAFGVGGTEISPCGSSPGNDNENCDRNGLFRSNQDMGSEEKKVQIFDGNSSSHFDDVIAYVSSTNSNIWSRTAATTIGQIDVVSTNSGNIKIGATSSSATSACLSECNAGCGADAACLAACSSGCTALPRTKLDVEGTVRALQVNSDEWCKDGTPSGCIGSTAIPIPYEEISARTLGGTPTLSGTTPVSSPNYENRGGGILCRDDMAMRGIYKGDEVCAKTTRFSGAGNYGTCPSGYYAIGINSDGSLCCNNTTCH